MRIFFASTAFIALLVATVPALADVKKGVDLWQSGDYVAAVKEWRPVAERGDADAQFNMGQAYKLGRGAPLDLNAAKSWFEKAARSGHVQAQSNLGLILFQQGNAAAAMPLIDKAARRDDARAQYVYGTALFNSDGVARDNVTAYAMMHRAAAQGLPAAKDSLAKMEPHISAADKTRALRIAGQLQGAGRSAAVSAPPPARPAQKAAAPAKPTPAPKPASAIATSAGGRWKVQLGAYGSPALARGQWATISKRVAALRGLQPSYEPAGKFTRLRVGPFADRATASKACAAAKAAGQDCIAINP